MNKNRYVAALLLSALLYSACSQTDTAQKAKDVDPISYADVIDSTYLYSHLSKFAHDSLQGRDTGSEGITRGEEYIASQYERLGIVPVGDDNSYFQSVDVNQNILEDYVYEIYSEADTEKTLDVMYVLDESRSAPIVPIYGTSAEVFAPVVFAGYGLVDDTTNINSFENIAVEGKLVLVFTSAPEGYEGELPSVRALYQTLIGQRRAAGIIGVSANEEAFNQTLTGFKANIGRGSGMSLGYLENNRGSWTIAFINPTNVSELIDMDGLSIEEYQAKLLENPAEFKGNDTGKWIKAMPGSRVEKVNARNIVGFIPGTDPLLKDEVVVLSAHHDHVGIGRADESGDTIYNGADDNGSGSMGLLAVAEALSRAKAAGAEIKRSILILHVTGEEKGLLGSRYYSDHPIFPIENTVADVNVDMIGRIDYNYQDKSDENYVYIIGAEIISSQLDSLLKEANRKMNNITLDMMYNDLDDPNQFYRRSDHWNFGRLGIPFAFFFNGVHDQYHRPADHVELIEFGQYVKRVQTIYAFALELANSPVRPVVDNQLFIERTQR